MATPFDHLPKFQRLPDEAKAKILEKFGQKSEEEKMQIMGRMGTPMAVQDNNPGLRSVEPVTDTLKKGLESYKEVAPDLEAGLTGVGINPSLAKAASKVFAYTPEIAGGAKGITEVGPGLVKGAVNIAQRAFPPSLKKSGQALAEAEIKAGARLPREVEPLVKVGRVADKARVEIDRIGDTLQRFQEKGLKPTGRWLTRQKDRIDLILKKFTKNQSAKDNLGQDAVVKGSKLRSKISDELNKQIPARVKPAKQYAYGKKREEFLKAAGKTAAKAALPASIVYGASQIFGGK